MGNVHLLTEKHFVAHNINSFIFFLECYAVIKQIRHDTV